MLAARKVFAEQGYREAKVGNIAAEAGVAKGTVYLHLADKRSIFAELTDRLFLRLGATILKVDTDGDVPSQVQHNIRTFIGAPGRWFAQTSGTTQNALQRALRRCSGGLDCGPGRHHPQNVRRRRLS